MEKNKVRPKILLLVSVVAAIICALLIPKVNVNSDMTKYLPDDSRMKQGLDILKSEFGQSASAAVADVRIMMESAGVPEDEMAAVADSISHMQGVDAVNVTKGEDHTLFELHVAKSVHQKKLASKIKDTFPYNCVSQTSQDGNTPDPKALVFAVLCLVVILIIMSKSFLEPLLFLISTGLAVAVNMGTNAFLPSVSITTFSLAAVLQLALSMDYSIILMSRFRQQMELCQDKYASMSAAVKNATLAILSSSLTTVVGLLMLVFMNLKIGLDLGIVLAKGVICSLIYTYLALPGLILICYDGVKKTEKRIPLPTGRRLSAFCEKFRIPLAVLFVLLFGLSFYLSTKTPMHFSTSTPTEIDKVFPKKNAVVVLYENEKEDSISVLLDKAAQNPRVESVFSYPTLLKKKLDAESMVEFLKEQAEAQGNDQAAMLTPELMRLCYYANYGDKNLKIGFTELVDFVTSQSDNPLLAKVDIPGLDEKLEMLKSIREMAAEPSVPAISEPISRGDRAHGPMAEADPQPLPAQGTPQRMTVIEYVNRVCAQQKSLEAKLLHNLVDTSKLSKKMTVDEMTAFMNSTPYQTKMVYSFSKNNKEGMTPVEFAHFLVEDLFNRKALAKMVNKDQKEGMIARMKIMDRAVSGATFSREELDALVLAYGLKEPLKDEAVVAEEEKTDTVETVAPVVAKPTEIIEQQPVVKEEESTVTPQEDPRLALLERMLKPGRKYDAAAMARNFRALGENVDEFTLSILYMFYGSEKYYDPSWKMDLEGLVGFIDEHVMNEERFSDYLGDDMKEQFGAMKDGLQEGVAALKGPEHSIAAIITDYPDESPETEAFVRSLEGDHILIGESVMMCEMKDGFDAEMRLVTILTILAIFTIVAISFRSLLTALILVMTVMTAVFINVAASGIGGGSDLYLAYLIVQSILMGATIDYGILFTTYYRENRDLKEAFRGSMHTILTSGLIISCVPGAMAIALNDALIEPIVKSLAIGSLSAVILILHVMPAVISLVFPKKN